MLHFQAITHREGYALMGYKLSSENLAFTKDKETTFF